MRPLRARSACRRIDPWLPAATDAIEDQLRQTDRDRDQAPRGTAAITIEDQGGRDSQTQQQQDQSPAQVTVE